MRSRQLIFVGLYAASGAAALVYEVTWTRLLTLQMGHTVAAACTVLAAFMGGLAVGSWIGGRVAGWLHQRVPAHHLRTYAALEVFIAVAAAALPAILGMLVPALAWAYGDGMTPARFALVRVAISVTLLGIPAAAMGATFPIAAEWFASASAMARRPVAASSKGRSRFTDLDSAGDAAALYAANTAGAAFGALAAGFWLVPALGLRGTTWAGAMLNFAAAAGALWLSRSDALVPAIGPMEVPPVPSRLTTRAERHGWGSDGPQYSTPKRSPTVSHVGRPALGCAASAISGFVALAYEVAWTRLLALVIGPTTYAFATMLASFISGLACGSAAGARLARRSSQPTMWLAAMLLVTAVAALIAGWFAASRLPLIVASQVADPDAAFGRVLVRQAIGVALMLLPMTAALGAAFPLALATALTSRQTVGRDAARVYASNTLGAIAGALVGGFALLPILGLQGTFRAAALVGLISAIGIWTFGVTGHQTAPRRVAMAVVGLFVGGVIVLLSPPWDRDLLASGAYKYAPYLDAGDPEAELRAGRLLYYKDGAVATVSVRQLAGMRSLAIDGKVDASNSGDMLTQRLLGLLPVLLHRDPQDILVIGLGSGVTVGSALAPGMVQRADVVEISPEVVEASAFFERENGGALGAPGVRLIVGDGRSHLLLTKRRYDVIISEPSNPWMAGIAALFTQEFFDAARARLKPGGLICQWAHTYDISSDDLRSIVRTFASVFPQGTMWLVGEGDLLLIGTTGAAIDRHLEGIAQHWRQGRAPAALNDVGVAERAAPFALLSLFVGGPAELQRYGGEARIQTDDFMALEFSAPRAIYGRSMNQNAAVIRALASPNARPPAIREAFDQATDQSWAIAGAMQLKANAHATAYDYFRRAVTLNSRNAEALRGLSEAAAGAHRLDEERQWLRSLAAAEPANAAVRIELSRLLAAEGDFEQGAVLANDAMRLAPNDPGAGEQLASVLADAGDADRLAPLADVLVSRFPERDKPRYYQAAALFLKGRVPEATDKVRQVVARNPADVRAQNLLGAACASAGQRDCAQAAFEASLRANPRDSTTYVNLGLFHLQSASPAAAAEYFAAALTLDPSSVPARHGLAEARAVLAAKQ